jgi:hypothetical protein
VPESGTPAAIGYAEASGIPYGQGLVKNSYVGRTFIQRQTIRQLGIGVNKGNPHARRRFTLCHEVKHVLDADRDKITYKDLTPEQREASPTGSPPATSCRSSGCAGPGLVVSKTLTARRHVQRQSSGNGEAAALPRLH